MRILHTCKECGCDNDCSFFVPIIIPVKESKSNSPYVETAKKIGELVTFRQETYGDSFGKSGKCLRAMYPDGIKPEQYDDLMAITRMLDKMFRIATGQLEDSYDDLCGYALLGAVRVRKNTNKGESV
jgi:hypothetical protein